MKRFVPHLGRLVLFGLLANVSLSLAMAQSPPLWGSAGQTSNPKTASSCTLLTLAYHFPRSTSVSLDSRSQRKRSDYAAEGTRREAFHCLGERSGHCHWHVGRVDRALRAGGGAFRGASKRRQ